MNHWNELSFEKPLDAIKFKVTSESNTSPYRAILGKTLADQSLPIRNVTDKSCPAAYLKK